MIEPAPPTERPRSPLPLQVAATVLVVLNVVLAVAQGVAGGESEAEILGAAGAPIVLAALAYVMYQHFAKRPTPRTAALVVLCTMAVILATDVTAAGRRARSGVPSLLSDAERKDLVVTDEGLHHPEFGFVAPHPGPGFVSDSGAQRQMNDRLAPAGRMFAWAFTHEDSSGLAVIQVTKGGADERGFRDFAEGMRSRMMSSGNWTVLEDSLIREAGRAEFRLAIQDSQSGIFVKWRCLASDRERANAFVVCAMTTAAEPTALDSFREHLTVKQPSRTRVP